MIGAVILREKKSNQTGTLQILVLTKGKTAGVYIINFNYDLIILKAESFRSIARESRLPAATKRHTGKKVT